jgi:hypothetical protein
MDFFFAPVTAHTKTGFRVPTCPEGILDLPPRTAYTRGKERGAQMKRTLLRAAALLGVCLLLPAGTVGAISKSDLDRVIDLSVTVKTLERLDPATVRDYRLDQRYLLLDGTITSVEVIDPEESRYQVIV